MLAASQLGVVWYLECHGTQLSAVSPCYSDAFKRRSSDQEGSTWGIPV